MAQSSLAPNSLAPNSVAPEVHEQVREALAASPIQSHRRIRVEQSGDKLYLHGRVESFYYKQLAQEVVRNICRGMQLSNELDVEESPSTAQVGDY